MKKLIVSVCAFSAFLLVENADCMEERAAEAAARAIRAIPVAQDANVHALDTVIAANMPAIQAWLDVRAPLSPAAVPAAFNDRIGLFANFFTAFVPEESQGSVTPAMIEADLRRHGLERMFVQAYDYLLHHGHEDMTALFIGLFDNRTTGGGCKQGYMNRMILALCAYL